MLGLFVTWFSFSFSHSDFKCLFIFGFVAIPEFNSHLQMKRTNEIPKNFTKSNLYVRICNLRLLVCIGVALFSSYFQKIYAMQCLLKKITVWSISIKQIRMKKIHTNNPLWVSVSFLFLYRFVFLEKRISAECFIFSAFHVREFSVCVAFFLFFWMKGALQHSVCVCVCNGWIFSNANISLECHAFCVSDLIRTQLTWCTWYLLAHHVLSSIRNAFITMFLSRKTYVPYT